MRLLDRYIARQVIGATLAALSVLVALFAFLAFVDDLDSVGKGRYDIAAAVEHMMLSLPRRIFSLLPLAAVIGSLVGLGALAATSELTVIRASGVSVGRLVGSVLKAATLLVAIGIFVGEVVAPHSERLTQERRSVALSDQITLKTNYGFWLRDGSSYINVRKVLSGTDVADVYIYEFDDARTLRIATHAARASYADGEWALEEIRQSELEPDRVESREIAEAVWRSGFKPDLMNVVSVRPESLSAFGLLRYLEYLEDNELDTGRFELALWSKVAYPLSTGVMIFLALPLVLGRMREVGLGQRIVVGTLLAIAFHVTNEASGKMGVVYGLNPMLSAFAPLVGFALLGGWLMRRLR